MLSNTSTLTKYMDKPIEINPEHWGLGEFSECIQSGRPIMLGAQAIAQMEKGRSYLENRMARSDEPIYGINTGFGSLCNIAISNHQLKELQQNLVRSHACGTGAVLEPRIVRLMLLLKLKGIVWGNSGLKTQTAQMLVEFYNREIYPEVFTQGSLGASGDLAPLAHLSLALLGEGRVFYKGNWVQAIKALEAEGLRSIELDAKEGLALLNGTQFMSAIGLHLLLDIEGLKTAILAIAALSCDAFGCRLEPFSDQIAKVRPHKGHSVVSQAMRELLENSAHSALPKMQVQDPYSFRCIPQVLGASWDAISHVQEVFMTEVNGVTDNPLIFPDTDEILSGGNFHGQPLALALDYLAIALSEIGSLSERRTFQLISGKRDLPEFLVKEPGLNSGLMIPQYTAAALASQNKQWCTPSSADSIVSSNGQEDHVSMGANAAMKCLSLYQNVEAILSIELLTAAQAFEFRRPATSSPALEQLLKAFREQVPIVEQDRQLSIDIQAGKLFIQRYFAG
jgi:histidine ammonia-lyase